MSKTTLTDSVRYGTSALDMQYKDYAYKDELLVQGNDGKIFYKRDGDGQIVTASNNEYNENTLFNAIKASNPSFLSNNKIRNEYVIYKTIDISKKMSLLENNTVNFNFKNTTVMKMSKNSDGFFIRVRGNDITNSIVNILENSYVPDNESTDNTFITLELGFKYSYSSSTSKPTTSGGITIVDPGTDVEPILQFKIKFNELTYIQIPNAVRNKYDSNLILESITFKNNDTNVSYNSLYNQLTDSVKTIIDKMNYNNSKLEPANIDIVTCSNEIDEYYYDEVDKVKTVLISSVNESQSKYDNSNGIRLDEQRPYQACLWGRRTNPYLSTENIVDRVDDWDVSNDYCTKYIEDGSLVLSFDNKTNTASSFRFKLANPISNLSIGDKITISGKITILENTTNASLLSSLNFEVSEYLTKNSMNVMTFPMNKQTCLAGKTYSWSTSGTIKSLDSTKLSIGFSSGNDIGSDITGSFKFKIDSIEVTKD